MNNSVKMVEHPLALSARRSPWAKTGVSNGCGLIGIIMLLVVVAFQPLEGGTPGLISKMRAFVSSKTQKSPKTKKSQKPTPVSYELMQLSPTKDGSQEFVPRSEPMSPDRDGEHKRTVDRDKKKHADKELTLDPRIVLAATVSSKGTFGAVVTQGAARKVVSLDSTNNLHGRQIIDFADVFSASFWGEDIMLIDSRGATRYWDIHVGDTEYGRFSRFDVPRCTPTAMAVDERGRYAIMSAVADDRGQLFHFFTRVEEQGGAKVRPWVVKRREGDSLKDGVTALSIHPTNNSFAVGTAHGNTSLWNIITTSAEGRQTINWSVRMMSIKTEDTHKVVAILQHDSYIASALSSGKLAWRDTRTGGLAHCYFDAHKDPISSFKHIKDYAYVTGSADSTVKLWDIRWPTRPYSMEDHGSPVAAITRADGGGFFSCSKNAQVKYWPVLSDVSKSKPTE